MWEDSHAKCITSIICDIAKHCRLREKKTENPPPRSSPINYYIMSVRMYARHAYNMNMNMCYR